MGLLNASMFGSYAPGTGAKPPAMPPMQQGMGPVSSNDFLSAFQNNPQSMQQLQAIQNGQGPGRQMPQFTPPMTQMNTAVPAGGRGMGGGLGSLGGNPINNYGMQMGDPGTYFMGLLGRPQG